MSKEKSTWESPALGGRELTCVRYGVSGQPLLLFPTAGGDAEEPERFHLISAIGSFLEELRLKVYCVDSIAGQAWLQECRSLEEASAVQARFDQAIVNEVVPAIRQDCKDDNIELFVAGASIGAFNSLAALCRHPEIFKLAICMSGTYNMDKFLEGRKTRSYYENSPLDFVPDLEGEHLERLRERFVLLAHGQGEFEEPEQSWRVERVLGPKGIPNRVDAWDEEWRHDWVTWREMLPQFLAEFLPAKAESSSEE
ncbi:MAG: alpha/beta hydrolase-fold protein [Planctomycetota bacterium]|nr:alpha/beta hydrolase-fold protein [Planctomycetota bacterium]